MEEAAWKALNFVYAERCGYLVGGGHSSCHGDITATHEGRTIAFSGGWHDAGDVSQQTVQSAEVVQALLELAVEVREDALLHRRLVEEARWGLDFVLRLRFGDGYRAFSAGMQAYAGQVLKGEDPDLAWVATHAGREDYGFTLERFEEVGAETRVVMEHTHNASLSQYWAAASWAVSQLYRAQLKSGIPVGPGHCVRHFPVWFSFRGNTAVLLSAGKAAAIVGRHFGDQALLDIARDAHRPGGRGVPRPALRPRVRSPGRGQPRTQVRGARSRSTGTGTRWRTLSTVLP